MSVLAPSRISPAETLTNSGACDGDRVDAEMAVETPIFDGFQRVGEQRRNVAGCDDEPVFAVRREQAADQTADSAARSRPRCRASRAARRYGRPRTRSRRAARVPCRRRTRSRASRARAGPSPHDTCRAAEPRVLAITEALELGDQVLDRQRAARHRARAGPHRPAPGCPSAGLRIRWSPSRRDSRRRRWRAGIRRP